ncbi:MAG: D-2-hydroxyacid dehydrogenase [Dehalococcoidia bacterium]
MSATNQSPIEVVVTAASIPIAVINEFSAIDARLHLRALTPEQRRHLRPDAAAAPEPAARELAGMLHGAEAVISAYEAPLDLLQRAPRLRWFHTFGAGIDQYVRSGFLRPGLIFTNGSGPTAIPIAEHCLMSMLMLAKGAPAYVRQQDARSWSRAVPGSELHGKTVGVIGLGQIGAEAARLAKAFGCRVIGMRRSVGQPREHADGVDLLLGPHDLLRLLAESDFVLLAAPATPDTKALINAQTLAQMKRGACLINIARGSLVDEAALLAALQSGSLAGAALDVFDPEPLPPASLLWEQSNVIVTPHVSSASEHTMSRQVEIVRQNLRRYLLGEPLLNVVPPERGY